MFRQPLTGTLSSMEIVLLEHLVLSAALFPVFWRTRGQWRRLKPAQWCAVLGVSWGGSALGTYFFTASIQLGNPTTAVLLQKTQPVLGALLARAILGERLSRAFWLWLAMAVLSAYLISFGVVLVPGLSARAALLALAAAAMWAGAAVLGRAVLAKLSFPALPAMRVILAVPLLGALLFASRQSFVPPTGVARWLYLVALAIVPGLLGLLAYYRGLQRTRASLAVIAELSFPATAIALNWVFLGARVSPAQLAGFLLLWLVILNLNREGIRNA
ncbi:MAG: DMT family transporter [Acidobacteria bacterium]|nr:DMT family transporter [Acidobacteriota bacterium]